MPIRPVKPKPEVTQTNPNRNPDGSYIVGKCRPPVDKRWKKGQSGNPNGSRKPKPDVGAAVIDVLEAIIALTTAQGKKMHMTQLEALMRKTYERAVKGDMRATKLLLDLYQGAKAASGKADRDHEALTPAEAEILKALMHSLRPELSESGAP